MTDNNEPVRFAPQPGPQTVFATTTADIAIYGGSAGGGKSFGIILEACRYINNPKYGAVIFRRKLTEITKEGGLWDEAMGIYPAIGAKPRMGNMLDFKFPSGASVTFGGLQYDESVLDWHSSQIAMLGFDELTTFTRKQFFYMLSRNRSTSGIRPYVRATCNPDCDSWVADFIEWWIDQDTGYAIPERSGVIRWMVRLDEEIHWFNRKVEAMAWIMDHGLPEDMKPKSVTFIAASLEDNPALMKKDPGYKANLYALGRVDRERLLKGNWKIRAAGGIFFKRSDFEIVDDYPRGDIIKDIRYWDFAGTEVKRSQSRANMAKLLTNDPDWTVGLRAVIDNVGVIYILDMVRERGSPGTIKKLFKQTTELDGRKVTQWIEEEPGSSGKFASDTLRKLCAGYPVRAERPTGSKFARATPYQAYAEGGNIKLVRGHWNEAFLNEHDAFPSPDVHDDTVDGGSGAYKKLTDKPPSTTQAMANRKRRR